MSGFNCLLIWRAPAPASGRESEPRPTSVCRPAKGESREPYISSPEGENQNLIDLPRAALMGVDDGEVAGSSGEPDMD